MTAYKTYYALPRSKTIRNKHVSKMIILTGKLNQKQKQYLRLLGITSVLFVIYLQV